MAPVAPRTLSLPDRAICIAEYGDPTGDPVLYNHGVPGSHIEAIAFDEAAAAAKLRIIAIDRPGIGGSPPVPLRRVVQWADVVAALADRLGLDRFAVVGVSGGGPYALACAHNLADRVTAAVVVSSIAPLDDIPGQRRGSLAMLRRFPFMARPVAARMAAQIRKPGGVAATIARMAPVDRARVTADPRLATELETNIGEAFRQGGRGFAMDLRLLFTRPWGFRLADITVPVRIWHGAADHNVPVSDGRRLAALLSNSRIDIVSDAGHLLFIDHTAAILESVRIGDADRP
ncbi:alpha/beta fold hydrolase [Nocardia arthritidis]|uniref:alpha/beta fold hydrolase n=1 Tax=Nocardia arthritidis TaxID=228602 RepID=UPI00142E2359|nr:alpha/beta hydrolase [Nocardia arthritidis]